jgi:N-acetylmuramoyl-L-alanine amidase
MKIGRLILAVVLLVTLWAPLHSADVDGITHRRVRVVIDPGQGGRDPGAIGVGGVREADINLAISRLILLKALGDPLIEIILTRSDDRFIEPTQRALFANQVNADLFVSIHGNGFHDPRAHGIETLIHTTAGQDSYLLATMIQRHLIDNLGAHDRGVKRQFLFIRRAQMPAVLVEVGFVSNPVEGRLLQRFSHQSQIAIAILAGIREFAATHTHLLGNAAAKR